MPEPAKILTALKQSKKSLVAMGKNILIYINVGTDETTGAKWELLGGQKTGDLNLKADSIDASHKGTGGWKTTLPGMKEWSTEVESILMLNDETLKIVYQAFLNDERIHIKYEYPDKSYVTGWASITDNSTTGAHDDVATRKITLNGDGPLSELKTV